VLLRRHVLLKRRVEEEGEMLAIEPIVKIAADRCECVSLHFFTVFGFAKYEGSRDAGYCDAANS
jgi:hypothetical protein